MKNKYCEPCKYQFNDYRSLQAHINITHSTGSKSPNPTPVSIRLMEPADQMYFYLKSSLTSREIYGVSLNKESGGMEILDHDLFMKLDHGMKERVTKAVEISNRRSK